MREPIGLARQEDVEVANLGAEEGVEGVNGEPQEGSVLVEALFRPPRSVDAEKDLVEERDADWDPRVGPVVEPGELTEAMRGSARSRLKALLEASAGLDQEADNPTAIERELLPNAMLVPTLACRIEPLGGPRVAEPDGTP